MICAGGRTFWFGTGVVVLFISNRVVHDGRILERTGCHRCCKARRLPDADARMDTIFHECAPSANSQCYQSGVHWNQVIAFHAMVFVSPGNSFP